MSGDEMIFDEVQFREPTRLRRPDHDPRFACIACQAPGPTDLPIFLDRGPADRIERHALSDTTVELGGVLLGKECIDPETGLPFVWVTQALEAKHYANTQASFTYTHDSWEEITRERERLHPDLDVVGWYHTHPNFGIFLSHHDLFIHQIFFNQPLQTAYVVDPIQGTRGFFQWSQGGMVQVGGFHLCGERSERVAISRLADQMEGLPGFSSNAGASLSPRLEAELIKMLNRPAQAQGIPGDRLALAAFLGFFTAALMAIVAAFAFWMVRLDSRAAAQAEALATLQREVDESTQGRKLAMDLLLEKVGGEGPDSLVERYERLARTRDDTRAKLNAQQAVNDALGIRVQDLTTLASALGEDLNALRLSAARDEADAKETVKLRKKVAELERSSTANLREIEDQKAILETLEGAKAAEMFQAMKLYRTTTVAGVIASLVLGGVALFFYYRSLGAGADAPRTARIDISSHS